MNDALYQEFERVTMNLISRGFKHFSADGVGHILRYETGFRESVMLKINNNSIALLARKFMEDHPEHGAFFQLRKSKHDIKLAPVHFEIDQSGQGVFA